MTIGGNDYQATYLGGDGNDVVLNYVDPANPILNGTPGSDSFTVKRNGTALEVYLGVDLIDSRDYSSVTTLVFNGGAGDDTLTLDFNDGNPLPSGELTFNGGGDSDS